MLIYSHYPHFSQAKETPLFTKLYRKDMKFLFFWIWDCYVSKSVDNI